MAVLDPELFTKRDSSALFSVSLLPMPRDIGLVEWFNLLRQPDKNSRSGRSTSVGLSRIAHVRPASSTAIVAANKDELFSLAFINVPDKVKQGMDSIRAGRTIPAEQVQAEMTAFKKKWKKSRNLK